MLKMNLAMVSYCLVKECVTCFERDIISFGTKKKAQKRSEEYTYVISSDGDVLQLKPHSIKVPLARLQLNKCL